VYYYARTDSALQAARECLAEGCPDGTFIYAGYQTAGRGRIAGRQWLSPAGENLLGTLILKQPASTDFTLRIGLAVSLTLDAFLPSAVRTAVKWPNDILINGKKTAGILCESAGGCLLAGIGINLLQTAFLRSIEYTATSLAMIIGVDKCPSFEVFIPVLLTQIQECLTRGDWNEEISRRLWKRGSAVRFMRGQQEDDIIEGILTGIAPDGALCITEADTERRYYSGELIYS
jgi:hypothetical protein